MKLTKINAGEYVISGHAADQLSQYSVYKNGHGWSVDRIYGNGQEFHFLYPTKREAVQAVTAHII